MVHADNIFQKLQNERLTRAIQVKDINLVKYLVLEGANVNYRSDRNNTPLHTAALGGNLEIVSFLLRFKADTSAVNTDGHTPVMLAEMQGHDMLANYLAVVEANFLYSLEKGNHKEAAYSDDR